jgi:ubiquinone/menaquinone biosynthesis C-methylase UbiE
VSLVGWLDRVLYRHPFEGRSARLYAEAERPAFGDLDDRLLDAMAPALIGSRRLLDVGAGPGTFVTRAAVAHPELVLVAVDPSRDFAAARPGVQTVRAAGEVLPFATGAFDVALCLSSIRHVRDRDSTLRELRRVVRRGGTLVIVELDPAATPARIAAHARGLRSRWMRHAFGPLFCKTAPPARVIREVAASAGWQLTSERVDPIQPVYILELT